MDYQVPHFVFWVKPDYNKTGVQACHFIPYLGHHLCYHSQHYYIKHAVIIQHHGNSRDDHANHTICTGRNIRRAP